MHSAAGGVISAARDGDFASAAAAAALREILSPLSEHSTESMQRFISSMTGMIAGAVVSSDKGARSGYSTALDAEMYNRQLHQREIAWIKAHAGEFAKTTGLSKENAKRLLTLAGMTLVDAKMAGANLLNVQALLDKGFTKEQVAYAQQYLTSNTNGETFHNNFSLRDQEIFSVKSPVEYFSSYDPNRGGGQIVQTVATDALGSAAMGAIVKAGGKIIKAGGKYYTKLKNGKTVEVPLVGKPTWYPPRIKASNF